MSYTIIIRMRGGLGNQLFQLGYGYYLKKNQENVEIILDISEFKTYKVREFELSKYQLPKYVSVKNYNTPIYNVLIHMLHLYQAMYARIMRKSYEGNNKLLVRLGIFFSGRKGDINKYKLKERNYVYGYFQDYKIVSKVRNEIINTLVKKNELSKLAQNYLLKIKGSSRAVAISIRCGIDYKLCGYPICSEAYYKKAIETIIQTSSKKMTFFIFSDEIQIVKGWSCFDGIEKIFIDDCDSTESLELMRNCNDFIISNSSFSWWGAFLSDSKDKVIYAPKQWYKEFLTREIELYYDDMILI